MSLEVNKVYLHKLTKEPVIIIAVENDNYIGRTLNYAVIAFKENELENVPANQFPIIEPYMNVNSNEAEQLFGKVKKRDTLIVYYPKSGNIYHL